MSVLIIVVSLFSHGKWVIKESHHSAPTQTMLCNDHAVAYRKMVMPRKNESIDIYCRPETSRA